MGWRLSIFLQILLLVMTQGSDAQSLSPTILKSKDLFENRKFQEATMLLKSIGKTSSDFASAEYFLGRIAVEEKLYEESITHFENAIHANENVAEYHNWLGVMYGVIAMDANSFKQAYLAPKIRNEFEKAASIDPLNLQTRWGLITYYCKAPRFLGGSWDKAIECAKIISQQNSIQGLRAYGFIFAAQNRDSEAEKKYLEAVSIEPSNLENDYALAQFYADQKKYDKALTVYENALKKNPKNLVTAFHFGKITAECGKQMEWYYLFESISSLCP